MPYVRQASPEALEREALRERLRERRLVEAARTSNPAARGKLVEAFLPSIAGMTRIYRRSESVGRLELMQEGVVGLLRALERFDAARGTPFWAYASWWVRQAMQELVAELACPAVLSDRARRQLSRIKNAQLEYMQAHGREPSTADLAAATGFAREKVESLIAVDRRPRALEEPVIDGDETVGTFGDQLADPQAEDEYERVDRRLEIEDLRGRPSDLGDRERMILGAHFGLSGRRQTLREIGGDLSLSAERVRQIEEQALEKLRVAAGL